MPGTGLLKAGRCRRGGSYQAVEEDPSVDRAHVAGVLVEQGLGPQRGRHKRHDQVLQGPAPPARPVSASQPGYPFTLPERLSSIRAELKALEDWCSPCQNVNLGQQPWTFLSYGFRAMVLCQVELDSRLTYHSGRQHCIGITIRLRVAD